MTWLPASFKLLPRIHADFRGLFLVILTAICFLSAFIRVNPP
jgi:hypothetical protein